MKEFLYKNMPVDLYKVKNIIIFFFFRAQKGSNLNSEF